MLPGLRFLFVAIVLSLSFLIFGFGAAALLRSAHEEFVSLPSRHAQPETTFTQQDVPATLAMLRVDAPTADRGDARALGDKNQPAVAPPPESQAALTTTEPEKPAATQEEIAALTDAVQQGEKSASTDVPVQAAAPPEIAASVEAERPDSKQSETHPEMAAATKPETTPSATTETIDSAPPALPPMDESARAAALKVATLGGPEVTIAPRAEAPKPAASGRRAHHRKRHKAVVRHRVVPQKPASFGLFDTPPDPDSAARKNAHAGPVATAGPSGKPHSAHDPS